MPACHGGASRPRAGAGETGAKRVFGGLTLDAERRYGPWLAGLGGDVTYAREKRNAFTRTGPVTGAVGVPAQTTRLGQLRLRGRAAYTFDLEGPRSRPTSRPATSTTSRRANPISRPAWRGRRAATTVLAWVSASPSTSTAGPP